MRKFELTIPQEYLDYIRKEIKKPKRPNEEPLELWLERELDIENPGSYGNLPTDESHVEIQVAANGNYRVTLSDACFDMIVAHVQPEPHSHKMTNEDIFHCWLDIKTNKVHAKEHIKVSEVH